MNESTRLWPSLLLYETTCQLPAEMLTAATALYHLQSCEYAHTARGERVVRPKLMRAAANRDGQFPSTVLEIKESVRTHPAIAAHPDPDWLEFGLLSPFSFMDGWADDVRFGDEERWDERAIIYALAASAQDLLKAIDSSPAPSQIWNEEMRLLKSQVATVLRKQSRGV